MPRHSGDVAGIKRYSEAMNAGDAYPLFAAMLTYKTWDTISGTTNMKTEAENGGGNGKSSVSSVSSSMLDVDRLKVTAYVESADEDTASTATGNQRTGNGVKADPMLQHYAALYAQEIAKILSKIPRFAFIKLFAFVRVIFGFTLAVFGFLAFFENEFILSAISCLHPHYLHLLSN